MFLISISCGTCSLARKPKTKRMKLDNETVSQNMRWNKRSSNDNSRGTIVEDSKIWNSSIYALKSRSAIFLRKEVTIHKSTNLIPSKKKDLQRKQSEI